MELPPLVIPRVLTIVAGESGPEVESVLRDMQTPMLLLITKVGQGRQATRFAGLYWHEDSYLLTHVEDMLITVSELEWGWEIQKLESYTRLCSFNSRYSILQLSILIHRAIGKPLASTEASLLARDLFKYEMHSGLSFDHLRGNYAGLSRETIQQQDPVAESAPKTRLYTQRRYLIDLLDMSNSAISRLLNQDD